MLGNSLASAIAAGDTDAVERTSSEYIALPLDRRPVDLAYQQCMLAWRYAAEGDHTLALRHQTVALDTAEQVGMPFLLGLGHLGLAHVLLARGDRSGAGKQLTLARDVALRAKLDVLAFPCLLARAHLALSSGDRAQGVDVLRAAFEMGRIQGYRNAYWWEPTWAGELAEQALRAGIEVPYVQDLVRRRGLAPRAPPVDCPAWPWRVKLYTLGRLQLLVDDRAVRFEGKARRRPLELLLGVVAFRGREVPEERLFEALWAGSEPDKAYASMKMTLARLRELLGDTNAIRLSNGCLTLDAARRCWVDSWEFERRLSRSADCRDDARGLAAAPGRHAAGRDLHAGAGASSTPPKPIRRRLRQDLRRRHCPLAAFAGRVVAPPSLSDEPPPWSRSSGATASAQGSD